MRTYYLQEKKQNLPAWLPPDPRGPPPAPTVQPVYSPPVGSTYGQAPAASGAQGLNSLFGAATQRTNAASPPPGAGGNGSLRAARVAPGAGAGRSASPFASQAAGGAGASQTGSLSARDRLKMGRSKGSTYGSSAAPAAMNNYSAPPAAERTASYDSGYENRFAPRDGGGSDKPFTAATSPWASNEAEFSGGGYDAPAAAQAQRRPMGLPAGGPGGGRRMGLPSGPRAGR